MKSNLQMLLELRLQYLRNLLLEYLNINCLENHGSVRRKILSDFYTDFFVITDTNLDNIFFLFSSIYNTKFWISTNKAKKGVGMARIGFSGSELMIFLKKWFCASISQLPLCRSNFWIFSKTVQPLNYTKWNSSEA